MVLLGDSADRLGAHQQEIDGSQVVLGTFEPLAPGRKLLYVALDRASRICIIRRGRIQSSDLSMAETFQRSRIVWIGEIEQNDREICSNNLIGIAQPKRLAAFQGVAD